MKKRRCGVGVAVLDGFLYAVGGHDGTSYLNSVERSVTSAYFVQALTETHNHLVVILTVVLCI